MNKTQSWSEMLHQLRALGYGPTKVAAEIGLSHNAVSDLTLGKSKEPKGLAAIRIHQMHSRLVVIPAARALAKGKRAAGAGVGRP